MPASVTAVPFSTSVWSPITKPVGLAVKVMLPASVKTEVGWRNCVAPFMMMAAFLLGAAGRESVVDEMVAAGPPGVRIWPLARVRGEERAVRRLGGGVWTMGEPGEGGRG